MDPKQTNRKRLVIIIAIISAILFLVLSIILTAKEEVAIEVFVVPSDSQVTMDGKPINAGQISVSPGEHKFAATRQHFGSVEKEINTRELDSRTVYLALYPNTPEGEAFLESNPDERLRYERISGAEFSALQNKLLSDYPITTKLPYQTLDYKIDYDVTKEKEVVFLVNFYIPQALTPGSEAYKQELQRLKTEVISYLESEGVDTSKTKIEYSPDPESL
jgi:hypothetical protein